MPPGGNRPRNRPWNGREATDGLKHAVDAPTLGVPAPSDRLHYPYDVVAVAASAGGLTALGHVLAALPDDFPATILIVQHLDPRHHSLMAEILSRHTGLQVREAQE